MKHIVRENSNRSSWRWEMERWKRRKNLEEDWGNRTQTGEEKG